jgi:hypothetical protein
MDSNSLTSTLLSSALISFCTFGMALSAAGQTNLEADFKAAHEKFRQAVITKNGEQLKAALSASAYMTMKNEGIDSGMDFPKDFFGSMPGKFHSGIQLSKLKTLRALEKNNTGVLIMFAAKSVRFDPFGMGGDPEAMLLVLSFTKEATVWKYETLLMESLSDDDEIKIKKNDLSILDEAKFKPSGVVPPVPALHK